MADSRLARGLRAGQSMGMASSHDSYWRLVRKRATKEARVALSIESGERAVIGIILTITAIALLWLLGSKDASWDATIERVGPWILMIIAVYPAVWFWKFIRTPPAIDNELRGRIASLEEQLLSQLEFVWMPDSVKEVYGPGSPTTIAGKLGQVIVRNKSTSEPARSVEVSLLSYINLDYENEEWIDSNVFSDSTQQLHVTLNPGRHDRFNLFIVKYRFDKLRLGPFAHGRRNNLESGRYKLTITTSAERGREVREQCFLRFDGYECIEFRKWTLSDDGEWSNLTQYYGSLAP